MYLSSHLCRAATASCTQPFLALSRKPRFGKVLEDESTPKVAAALQEAAGTGRGSGSWRSAALGGMWGYVGAFLWTPDGFWAELRGVNKRKREPKESFSRAASQQVLCCLWGSAPQLPQTTTFGEKTAAPATLPVRPPPAHIQDWLICASGMEMGKRRGNISLWRPSVCPAVVRDRLYCPWDGRPLAPQLLLGVTGAQKAQPLRRRSLNMVGLLRAPSSGKVLGEGGFRGGGGGSSFCAHLGNGQRGTGAVWAWRPDQTASPWRLPPARSRGQLSGGKAASLWGGRAAAASPLSRRAAGRKAPEAPQPSWATARLPPLEAAPHLIK